MYHLMLGITPCVADARATVTSVVKEMRTNPLKRIDEGSSNLRGLHRPVTLSCTKHDAVGSSI